MRLWFLRIVYLTCHESSESCFVGSRVWREDKSCWEVHKPEIHRLTFRHVPSSKFNLIHKEHLWTNELTSSFRQSEQHLLCGKLPLTRKVKLLAWPFGIQLVVSGLLQWVKCIPGMLELPSYVLTWQIWKVFKRPNTGSEKSRVTRR